MSKQIGKSQGYVINMLLRKALPDTVDKIIEQSGGTGALLGSEGGE
jgi:hypothetical protein